MKCLRAIGEHFLWNDFRSPAIDFVRTLKKFAWSPVKTPVARGANEVMFRVMDWQQAAALLIVATSAALLLRSKLRRRPFGLQAGSGCGACGNAEGQAAAGGSIVFRGRTGKRPEIHVKMR